MTPANAVDFSILDNRLSAVYGARNGANRWDHARRLAERVTGWLEADGGELPADFDREATVALAHLLPIRDALLGDVAAKGRAESCFVEAGWAPLRVRELFRSLERLPGRPVSEEEKLVADAETLARLGMLGFARHLTEAAADGGGLAAGLAPMQRALAGRLYTKRAQVEAGPLRDELRDLWTRLRNETQ